MVWNWLFGDKKKDEKNNASNKQQKDKTAPQIEKLKSDVVEEEEWIYELLIQYFTSPLWKIPIYEFIDDHCICFDVGEENKFEYTNIHNEFKKVIEIMVESLMTDTGINDEQFYNMCKLGLASPKHRQIFEQILIIDNFLVFKKLMIKRNKEMELEALKALEQEQQFDGDWKLKQTELESEKQQIEFAIQMSLAATEEEKKMIEFEEQQLKEALLMSMEPQQDQKQVQVEQQIQQLSVNQKEEQKQEEKPSKVRPLTQLSLTPLLDKKYEVTIEELMENHKEVLSRLDNNTQKEQVEQKEEFQPQEKLDDRKQRLLAQRELMRKKKQQQREVELKEFKELNKEPKQDQKPLEESLLLKEEKEPIEQQVDVVLMKKRANLLSKIKADMKN